MCISPGFSITLGGPKLLVCDRESQVGIVDIGTKAVESYIPLPDHADATKISFSPDGMYAYTNNLDANSPVSIVDLANRTSSVVDRHDDLLNGSLSVALAPSGLIAYSGAPLKSAKNDTTGGIDVVQVREPVIVIRFFSYSFVDGNFSIGGIANPTREVVVKITGNQTKTYHCEVDAYGNWKLDLGKLTEGNYTAIAQQQFEYGISAETPETPFSVPRQI